MYVMMIFCIFFKVVVFVFGLIFFGLFLVQLSEGGNWWDKDFWFNFECGFNWYLFDEVFKLFKKEDLKVVLKVKFKSIKQMMKVEDICEEFKCLWD